MVLAEVVVDAAFRELLTLVMPLVAASCKEEA